MDGERLGLVGFLVLLFLCIVRFYHFMHGLIVPLLFALFDMPCPMLHGQSGSVYDRSFMSQYTS